MSLTGTARSVLLASLESVDRAHPTDAKRLIGPDVNYGRELLVALARRTGGWIGWEATNLRRIAGELAFAPLHRASVRIGGDIEIAVLVNHALDAAIDKRTVSREIAYLARGVGFRQTLRDAVLELRIAGVTASSLHSATTVGSPARELVAVLDAYEALLADMSVTDSAGVFRAGLDNFDDEARYCLQGELLLAPTLVERGLPARLLDRLVDFGARILDGDSPVDVAAPHDSVTNRTSREAQETARRSTLLAWTGTTAIPAPDDTRLDASALSVDLFSASTPVDELREIFRRIMSEGLRWDDVEIVTTDADRYGVALDVVCEQAGVAASMLQGIPLARTRLGRVLERWFAWLENDLSADILRQALEAGEIGVSSGCGPTALARELRAQRIGWGRKRYAEALVRLEQGAVDGAQVRRHEDESDAAYEARSQSRRSAAGALGRMLDALLRAVPDVPARGDDTPVSASVPQLATATLAWLDQVDLHGDAELRTAERVRMRLKSLAEFGGARTSFGTALATLRNGLSDVRAWPSFANAHKPSSSTGGMVHLTDIGHTGTTGRPRVFVVGLDADAVGGSGRSDPLLPDVLRATVDGGALSTTTQRRDERAYLLNTALASLRGRVTISYAISGSLDGTIAGPAPVLLQVHRLLMRDGGLSYSDLRGSLGPPACAVPARSSRDTEITLLDGRDVWLDSIADDPVLLDGTLLVRGSFPALDAGLRAGEAALESSLTPFTGYVKNAAGKLDPRNRAGYEISASALEKLATCPLAWFYHYGLGLRPPEDPTYDPDAWLDNAQRGSVLHEVFETFAKEFADRREHLHDESAERAMTTIVDSAIARWLVQVPAPGAVVFDREVEELRLSAKSFLEMERKALSEGDSGAWRYLEFAFGGSDPSGTYALDDGTSLSVRGRVDRIDALDDGSFRVIDYKTGKASRFRRTPKLGKFNGGRQLQPALYAGVLDALLGGKVTRFEYRFPTERGRNATVSYTSSELDEARPLITGLLDHVRDGTFVPTTSVDDCRYCGVRAICRVSDDRFGKLTSRRAAWANANAEGLDAYQEMLLRRTKQART